MELGDAPTLYPHPNVLVHIYTLLVRPGCVLLSHCVCPQSITLSLRRQLGLVLCVWGGLSCGLESLSVVF